MSLQPEFPRTWLDQGRVQGLSRDRPAGGGGGGGSCSSVSMHTLVLAVAQRKIPKVQCFLEAKRWLLLSKTNSWRS